MARKHNFRDVSFSLSDEDQIRFNDYYVHNSAAGKRSIWFQKLMVPVMTVLFIFFMKNAHASNKLLVGGTLLLVFLSVVMWRKADETVTAQQFRSMEGPGRDQGSREYKMVFGDEAVEITFNGVSKEIPYAKIVKISKSEDCLYMWLDKRMVFPIPKRAFDRDTDIDDLYGFLVEHLQH